MIQEETQQDIYQKTIEKLNAAMKRFSSQINHKFEIAFKSLSQLHKQKQTHKDKIILEQKQTISNMKKFMDGFAQNYQQVIKGFGSQSNNDNLASTQLNPELNQNKSIPNQKNTQIPKKKSTSVQKSQNTLKLNSRSPIKSKIKENTKPSASKSVHSKSSQKQKRKVQKLKAKHQKSHHLESKSHSASILSKKKKLKTPIQCLSNYPVFKFTFTPNITKLQYVQYECKKDQLDEEEIETLSKHDLSGITSVVLSSCIVTNDVLSAFTKLQWNNLKSLRLDFNMITDIRPLGNLNLKIIEDLDVSFNQLNTQSAYFLAYFPFNQLIYFTVSFDTGIDEECWEILLRNNIQNYPKLQAIDIGNSNQLVSSIRKRIQQCIHEKSIQQRLNYVDQKENHKYPQNYEIKINWVQSKEIYETYSEQKRAEIFANFAQSMKIQKIRLARQKVKGGKKYKRKIKVVDKRKKIHKQRVSVRNRKQKMQQRVLKVQNQQNQQSEQQQQIVLQNSGQQQQQQQQQGSEQQIDNSESIRQQQ